MDPLSLQVGDVAIMPLPDGGYGACQVVARNALDMLVFALDWHSPQPPTRDQLAGAAPLILDHHARFSRPAAINIGNEDWPPATFRWIGQLPVPCDIAHSDSSSSWDWLVLQVAAQHTWTTQLPRSAKIAYRVGFTRGQVEVNFGGGAVTMGAAVTGLDLTGAGNPSLRAPATGEVRWQELDKVPRCVSLVWEGPDRGLIAALTERPIITHLLWRDPPAEVDLRGTSLVRVAFTGAGSPRIRLPRSAQSLDLADGAEPRTVEAAEHGRWLHLQVTDDRQDIPIPAGLHGVRALTVIGGGIISARALAQLSDLEELRLVWNSAPGELTDASAMAGLTRLATVNLQGCYSLAANTLPDMPSLACLDLNGLRSSVLRPLKTRYARTAVHLDIWGAKSDRWLDLNFYNPFRDWVHVDARGGVAACKAFATATKALARISAAPAQRAVEAEPILHALIDQLNRIDGKYRFIDTICREDAGEAFCALAEHAGVPAELADEWFDDWRDF